MIVEILGCGTSTGVPLIHCKCKVCRSKTPKNKRLRASIWIQTRGKNLLIDASTDLRQQAIRSQIPRIDAVLITHPHADHIGGMDELRSFNFHQKERIPIFGNQWTNDVMRHRFEYIFTPRLAKGGGIPLLDLHLIQAYKAFEAAGVRIQPIATTHGSQECLAFRIEKVAYVTDCKIIPPQSLEALRDLDVLILDCLRVTPHDTHLNLAEALEIIAHLKPRKTFLTHMGHDLDYGIWNRKLPKGVALAYDGLKIRA